jgi:hypothetical protein
MPILRTAAPPRRPTRPRTATSTKTAIRPSRRSGGINVQMFYCDEDVEDDGDTDIGNRDGLIDVLEHCTKPDSLEAEFQREEREKAREATRRLLGALGWRRHQTKRWKHRPHRSRHGRLRRRR